MQQVEVIRVWLRWGSGGALPVVCGLLGPEQGEESHVCWSEKRAHVHREALPLEPLDLRLLGVRVPVTHSSSSFSLTHWSKNLVPGPKLFCVLRI